jgi:hypothetical protein
VLITHFLPLWLFSFGSSVLKVFVTFVFVSRFTCNGKVINKRISGGKKWGEINIFTFLTGIDNCYL